MTRKTALVTIGALTALMVGTCLWTVVANPDLGEVPVHFNLAGEADRYGPAWRVLAIMPIVSALMLALLWAVPHIDPRGRHIAQSEKAVSRIFVILVEFFAFVHVVMIATALDWLAVEWTARLILAGAAALLALIGNLFGKLRSNFFIGFRTPWTLSSEYSWEKTHRLAGRLFVAAGGLGGIAALAAPLPLFAALFGVGLTAAVIVPLVMSYVWWREDPARAAA